MPRNGLLIVESVRCTLSPGRIHHSTTHSTTHSILGMLSEHNKCRIDYKVKYLKANEELWEFKYFAMQKYNLQKNPLKENQNPSRYYNSRTNLKL